MRTFLIPFSVWLLALQLPYRAPAIDTLAGVGEFLSAAAALAAFTVAVYRLGVWRQEMHHTRDTVSAELARFREEMHAQFASIERRIDDLEDELLGEAA